MAVHSDYTSGTISLAQGSVTVTGAGTLFQVAQFREGDTLQVQNLTAIIKSVDSNTQLTLSEPWTGTTLTDAPYRARFMADNERVAGQSRNVIELLGNGVLSSIAELGAENGKILIGNSSGGYSLIDQNDLKNGVKVDAHVADLAGRALYDDRAVGFAVFVSDTGDGRSAVYSKQSNTSADWSAPAYITGPAGPAPNLAVTETTTLPPGESAKVTSETTPTGVNLHFSIPAGRGFTSRGTYAAATTYQIGDVVAYNGSSYIAKVVTQGVLPTNATNWDLLALKGTDGTGTGDVVGPTASVANRLAVFNGTTGKLILDGGVTIDQIRANTANVGAAVAGANGRELFNDADSVAGVISGTGTLVRWTWGNIKAWVKGFVTKGDVGLPDVDNTSDASKPVSTAQAAAIALKVAKSGDANIGGYSSVLHSLGNSSGRSIKPDLSVSNFQHISNTGAFTLQAPDVTNCTIAIQVWNEPTAGAMTATGFTKVNGTFATTSAKRYQLLITCIEVGKTLTIMEAN